MRILHILYLFSLISIVLGWNSFAHQSHLLIVTQSSDTKDLSSTMNFTEIIDKIRAGETAEEVVTPEMTLLSKEVTDEEPKIEIALKNFMSILLAQSATSHSHRDEFGDPVHITPDTALRSIRVLLKKINSWVLLDVVQWGVEHPQADGETAMARLDSLTRYKVLASLHGLALQKGGKTAKLFGAKFFLWTQVWPALRDSLLSELYPAGEGSAAESPDEQCLRFILKQFEQSLSSGERLYIYNSALNMKIFNSEFLFV